MQNGYWYVSVDGRKVAFYRFVMETVLGELGWTLFLY
jgi:hypothetical protein